MRAYRTVVIRPCIAAVLLLTGLAHAQPGAIPPMQPYPTYGYPQPPQLQLTAEEMETLSIGYITDGQYIGGGVASLFVGFGVGQAVEGRWHDTGWIFTLGEPVAFGVFIYGLMQNIGCIGTSGGCSNNHDAGSTAIVVGAVSLVGLRLWEVIDAFVGPSRHNERYRALQMRLGNPMPAYTYRPFVAPSNGGAVAGLSLSF